MTEKRSRKTAKRTARKTRKKDQVSKPKPALSKTEQSKKYINDADWRYQHITFTTEDFIGPAGIKHEAGAIVEISAIVKLAGKQLTMPMPSMVAMYLNISHKAHEAAEELFTHVEYQPSLRTPSVVHLKNSKPSMLYDMMEERIKAIVFAFTAIETFANEVIPTDFVYTRKTKKSSDSFDKHQIERYVPTDEKLTKVLPEVKQVTSPAGNDYWQVFMRLKDERDSLIHLKHKDKYLIDVDTDEGGDIWNVLAGDELPNYAVELQPLFEHYFPEEESRYLWMQKTPFWNH